MYGLPEARAERFKVWGSQGADLRCLEKGIDMRHLQN